MSDLTVLVVAVGCGALAGAVVYLVVSAVNRRRTPTGRPGECQVCGKALEGKALHEVRSAQDDTEFGGQGGTWTAAEFCVGHCPGGCVTHRH